MLSEAERQMPHLLSNIEPSFKMICMCVNIGAHMCVGHGTRKGIIRGRGQSEVEKQGVEYVCREKRGLGKWEAKDGVEGRRKLGEGQWGRGTNDNKV